MYAPVNNNYTGRSLFARLMCPDEPGISSELEWMLYRHLDTSVLNSLHRGSLAADYKMPAGIMRTIHLRIADIARYDWHHFQLIRRSFQEIIG